VPQDRPVRVVALCVSLVAWALSTSGCAPRPRTQVTVTVDAEPAVAAAAVRLAVRVEGGASDLALRAEQTLGTAGEPIRFPVDVALVPLAGDTSRRFRLQATALDASGGELGTVRVLSGFVAERTFSIRLVLEDCCRSVRCGAQETCRACACAPDAVPPPEADAGTAFPDDAFGPDAFAPVDAAQPGLDAGTPPPCDFARDGCVSLAGPSLELGTDLGPRRWSRPVAGTCPASLAAGSYGYDVLRVHNPTAGNVALQLDTTASLVDSFLVVYEEPFPDFTRMPALPADPSACLVALDETAGAAPHVVQGFTFEPGDTALVVITTSAPDQVGRGSVRFLISR
jgi:hypothetical protein